MSIESRSGSKPEKKISLKPQIDLAAIGELSESEKEAIRERARKSVAEDRRKQAEDAYYQQALQEERTRVDPDQQLEPIFLDLAGHMEHIMLDNTLYYHGHLYHVVPSVFAVLAEQMARGWAHEEQTEVRDTKTRRRFRTPAHIGIGNFMDNRRPRDMTVSSGQLAGAKAEALLRL